MSWVVAVTDPNLEARAARNLHRQEMTTYLPRYMSQRHKIRLLFPRYLFIYLTDAWHRIFRTDGIAWVLLNGAERPSTVSDQFIDQIKSTENKNGMVQVRLAHERFKAGQKLHIVRGQFRNLTAAYAGMSQRGREMAFVELMGRLVRVEFDDGHLAADVC